MGLFDRNPEGGALVSPIAPTTGGGGGGSIIVQDEGTPLTTAVTKFNFAGAGVTVTEPVANEILVTIPGGGSSVLANDTFLKARNAANSADVNIVKVDAFDRTVITSPGTYILFNKAAIPDTNNSFALGTSGVAWSDVVSVSFNANDVGILNGTATTPSGVTNTFGLRTSQSATISLFSANNATNDAIATKNVLIETGNKTDGTGGSGDIIFQTGTSVGGVRGTTKLDSLRTFILDSVGNAPTIYFGALNSGDSGVISSAGGTSPGDMSLFSGTASGAGNNSGNVTISSGGASIATTGNVTVTSGGSSYSGAVSVGSGSSDNGTGITTVSSGETIVAGDSGATNIFSGNAIGNSGDITVQTGTAGGTRGSVVINANLITVHSSIVPNANNSKDLGASGQEFLNIYVDNLYSSGNCGAKVWDILNNEINDNTGVVSIKNGARELYTATPTKAMDWLNDSGVVFHIPLQLVALASDPAGATTGTIYFNTTSGKIKVYNGTTWETVTSV